MADRISAGAYVIRNRQSGTVLHVENPDVSQSWSQVLGFEQDENQYRDQQIWWVEPLPNYEDDEDGVVFSITNPSSGKSLDLNAANMDEGQPITAFIEQGVPWQRWRVRRVQDGKEGVYFNIINVHTGYVLDLKGDNPESGASCYSQKYRAGHNQHEWEFVIPLVAFPPGWFHIQNAGTGDLLTQTYLSSPPVLIQPPQHPSPSQFRESWGAQWTLAHVRCYEPKSNAGRNSWRIVNRLTRALLSNQFYTFKGARKISVNAFQTTPGMNWGAGWKLELDPACNWKIMNQTTGHLLGQTTSALCGGMEVACVDKKFITKDGTKSWVLRSPALETVDESPPEYVTEVPVPDQEEWEV